MEESYLCQRCRSVDWDAAFAPIPPGQMGMRKVLQFRSTLEARLDSHCRLCLAIASLFRLEDVEPTDELDQCFTLIAARSEVIYGYLNIVMNKPGVFYMPQKNCPTWLVGTKCLDKTVILQPGAIVENRALEPGELGFEFGLSRRRTVDFDRLRRWLSDCRRREPCARPLDLPGMRAIDCELREIVSLTCAQPEYATLSYVWGQSEVPCSTDGKLPDRLPLTIEDSIIVCQELGVRYLWVDRYCIQESHKHTLIRSMHRIYHESQFTIVAAAGCGPNYGLPGVGNTTRSDITVVDRPIHIGLRQLSYIKNIRSHLKRSAQQTADSKWAKRAWTFQEGILSKRICIFLDDEVHLEDDVEAQNERTRPCAPTRLGPKLTYPGHEDYWQTVSAYCSRDLTYPEDAFNAISGIFSTWTQNMRAFRHISGLAVEFDSDGKQLIDDSVLISLAWRVFRPVPRRWGFPSWAWTGWLKPEMQRHATFGVKDPTFALNSVETDDGNTIHHTQLLDLLRVQHELLDSIKILHITAKFIDICITPSNSMPSIDQHLCGDQNPKSEWRAMVVLDGIERVYECEITKLIAQDDMCLSTSRQYIQCKGLAVARIKGQMEDSSYYDVILIMVWDEDGGYYERFGTLLIPWRHTLQMKVEAKVEKIRLG